MSINMEQIVREYIDKSLHMSLGTASGDQPWVCEVHFVYDDNLNLYFRSLSTSRHSQEIAANPRVAGNIVRQHAIDEYPHAVYFEGTAAMVTDETRFADLFARFRDRLGAKEGIVDEAKTADGHKFYQIAVENWYAFGKFGADHGEKHKLAWKGGRA